MSTPNISGLRNSFKSSTSVGEVKLSHTKSPIVYVAKKNDTPRIIAQMFDVHLVSLVELNKLQYPTLLSH